MGFEPTNGGFADLSLGPLGYRANVRQYIEKRLSMSVKRVSVREAQARHCEVLYCGGSGDLRFSKKAR